MTIFVSLKTGSQRRGSRKQARKPAPGAASGGQRFVEIDLILKGIKTLLLRACLETSAFIVTRRHVDKKNCARQQKLAKTVKRYPSDLTDKEWALVRPLLPPASGEGRRRKTDLREIINALRYLIRSGCSWRMLPQEFGPWQTVYWWFRRLMRRFLFATILDICTMLDRHRQKKTLAPSLAVLDSQSVKAPHASDRGIDAHKKIVGRKRHVAVDSDGRLLLVNMTPANVADSTGAQMILDAMYRKWPSVKHFFADGAYERKSLMDKAAYLGFVVEVVKRTPGQTGFQPVAKRWVVERTFGWLVRWRYNGLAI